MFLCVETILLLLNLNKLFKTPLGLAEDAYLQVQSCEWGCCKTAASKMIESKSSTTVSQHHSAPEDLLPPFTRPLPDEPCPWGPSVAPPSTPAGAPGQPPGGVRLRGVWPLLHTALPLSSSRPASTWNTQRLSQKTARSLWWLVCWDRSVDTHMNTHRGRCKVLQTESNS